MRRMSRGEVGRELVGTVAGDQAVYATVCTSSNGNQQVRYYSPQLGTTVRGGDIVWSEKALRFGIRSGGIGANAVKLDTQTVLNYVAWRNLHKDERSLPKLGAPPSP